MITATSPAAIAFNERLARIRPRHPRSAEGLTNLINTIGQDLLRQDVEPTYVATFGRILAEAHLKCGVSHAYAGRWEAARIQFEFAQLWANKLASDVDGHTMLIMVKLNLAIAIWKTDPKSVHHKALLQWVLDYGIQDAKRAAIAAGAELENDYDGYVQSILASLYWEMNSTTDVRSLFVSAVEAGICDERRLKVNAKLIAASDTELTPPLNLRLSAEDLLC